MKDIVKYLCFLLLALIVITLGSFRFGYKRGYDQKVAMSIEEKTIIKHVVDSIFIEKPTPKERVTEVDTLWFALPPDTLRVHDTLLVPLPIETLVYEDSLFTAWVSGYHASLDSIWVRKYTEYVDREVVKYVPTKVDSKWAIGLTVGYGLTIDQRALKGMPYVGVGLTYKIFQW